MFTLKSPGLKVAKLPVCLWSGTPTIIGKLQGKGLLSPSPFDVNLYLDMDNEENKTESLTQAPKRRSVLSCIALPFVGICLLLVLFAFVPALRDRLAYGSGPREDLGIGVVVISIILIFSLIPFFVGVILSIIGAIRKERRLFWIIDFSVLGVCLIIGIIATLLAYL